MALPSAVAPYAKPFTAIAEQIERLEKRGMAIGDRKKAELWLKRVGYYRLSGYWYELRERDNSTPDGPRQDTFRPGSALSEVIKLYLFDERLRQLILQAVCPIEVALRAHIVRALGRKNPLAHLDSSFFQTNFTQPQNGHEQSAYDRWLEKIHSSVQRSENEQFIEHFFQKYCSPHDPEAWKTMPLWIMADCWDFGLLSKCCSGLSQSHCRKIAQNFGELPVPILVSWMYTLNTARNFAAHHSRLWNRWWNVARPKMPSKRDLNGLFSHIAERFPTHPRIQVSTYMRLAIIKYFLLWTVEDRGRGWSLEIKALLNQLPGVFGGPEKLGFPENWEREALWTA